MMITNEKRPIHSWVELRSGRVSVLQRSAGVDNQPMICRVILQCRLVVQQNPEIEYAADEGARGNGWT